MSDNWFGGGNKQPATSTQSPWDPTQQPLKSIMGTAGNLYNQYKNKSTLAPINGYTTDALNQTRALAAQGIPNLDAVYGAQSSLLGNGGMTSGMNQAAGILGGIASSGGMSPDLQEAAGYLKNFASGQYNEDPRLLSMVNAERDNAMNAMATRMGGGRYGSAAMGTGFANASAQATDRLMLESNENNRNRQLQSAGILGDMYQGAANRGLSAAGAMGSLYSQGADNMMGAMSMTGALNNLRYDSASRLASVGDYYQQRDQANYDKKFDRLAQLSSFINPIAGMGKTTTATKATPSAAQGILGGAMAGNTLLGPWGALGGGILGGLGAFS
ncbi:hypothetical protein [Microvirga lotononidis]|uniref:Uncharacterized protein n=1 Tax=Microvirga lotononidis TaxID=864069 RepID=I4YRQ9_9HYPH|nr:hypothetical protein [Microvirga lotononidis]EIM26651.1 hypothetical protein MicloDRAFT_00032000 [Microvirga lotononidis]WQO32115.1 hypothetical protein U0023_35295 [Microvirga lotononidis]